MKCPALLLILFLPVMALAAAEKVLPGHVPASVAPGKVTLLGHLPDTNLMHLSIGLPLHDLAGLTNLIREIYDPSSPHYHQYLTPREFAARFSPRPSEYEAVIHFAERHGLKVAGRHADRLVLDVTGRAGDVERAFHVRLNNYRQPSKQRIFYAPDTNPVVDASLPILHVSGLDDCSLPQPLFRNRQKPALQQSLGGSATNGAYFGYDFRNAYVPGTTLDGTGQTVALLQFDDFYPVDITNYATATGLPMPSVQVETVDGGVSGGPGFNQEEVALDIEMVMSMAPGISNILVYEAPNGSHWEDILGQMADDDTASQLSSSWFNIGPNPTADQIFLQMAAQGQSFFNAAGDNDAYYGPIVFPCDNPYITVVGGTSLTTDNSGNYVSETVWNDNNGSGGGGGISTDVPIPPWQLGIDLTAAQGSTTMRNIPDVSLLADNIFIYDGNGGTNCVDGTSCAAPLWAAYAALVNQQEAQLSRPPVGFLNPTIYALGRGANYAGVFHDITNGDNTSFNSPMNFFAVPGYDLCTGWGTPNGTNLINELTTPDFLGLSPLTVHASGRVAGPYYQTNWTLTVTNSGPTNLDWALGPLPAWLTGSPVGGVLPAGGATNVSLQPVYFPNSPMGNYIVPLEVTNVDLQRVETVAFLLDVGESIVANGGFETGDFTGWTLNGDTTNPDGTLFDIVITDGQNANVSDVVHSRNYGAFLGETGRLANVYQTLRTVPGQQYLLSFWLDNPNSGSIQEFDANWNGTSLISIVSPPAFDWTNCLFLVTATGTNTVLDFDAENDVSYFGLDDVSLVPVPPVVFQAAATSITNGGLQMSWYSAPNLKYQIMYTTNLVPANWQSLGAITASTNISSFLDTTMFNTNCQGFYQLELLPSVGP